MTLPVTIEELRVITTLADLTDDQLLWILERCEYRTYNTGDYLARMGQPATDMLMVLEGTFHAKADTAEAPAFILTKGMVTGFLPFSRMTQYPVSTRAQTAVRVLALHKQHFPALYQEIPQLIPKLVGILTDRVRESTRAATQEDKLAAIGKLSAGLAHELNNPAAAARQASQSAREYFNCYRETLDRLAVVCSSKEIYDEVRALETRAGTALSDPVPIDSLTRSDLEGTLETWLESIGVEEPWHVAPAFVDAGFTAETLDAATSSWTPEVRELALYRVVAAIEMEQIHARMQSSSARISDLVNAMKDYSYMDQSAATEIDLNHNLETTLRLFSFRFKSNIKLVTNYAPDMPKLCGHGGQLNQIWTNLIDNALDAMESQGDGKQPGELRVTTRLSLEGAVVEISDNGPGIPQEVQAKVFDPFFTTKPQGEGTGLGLDTVYRIIKQHHGSIRFDSEPGATTFFVCLPLPKAQ